MGWGKKNLSARTHSFQLYIQKHFAGQLARPALTSIYQAGLACKYTSSKMGFTFNVILDLLIISISVITTFIIG